MKTQPEAVFLIDLQVGNINNIFEPEKVVAANKKVLEIARAAGLPVYHFKYHEEQRDIRFGKPWTEADTKEGEFHHDLVPLDNELFFTKPAYGAFSVTQLEQQLATYNIQTIWLTGVMSQVCVLATAYEAYAREYQVNVILEAVGATNGRNLELGLEWMRKYVADIKTLSDFENHLN